MLVMGVASCRRGPDVHKEHDVLQFPLLKCPNLHENCFDHTLL